MPLLNICLAVAILYQITTPQMSNLIVTTTIASLFSPKGLDDPSDINQIRQQVKSNKPLVIVPGINLNISGKEIENLSPRQTRLLIAGKLTANLYKQGSEGIANMADNIEMQKKIIEGFKFFNFFTEKSHKILFQILLWSGIFSILLFSAYIWITFKLGKFLTPGVTLIETALLPWILAYLYIPLAGNPIPLGGDNPIITGISNSLSQILPPIAQIIEFTYRVVLIAGGIATALSLFGIILWKIMQKRTRG